MEVTQSIGIAEITDGAHWERWEGLGGGRYANGIIVGAARDGDRNGDGDGDGMEWDGDG